MSFERRAHPAWFADTGPRPSPGNGKAYPNNRVKLRSSMSNCHSVRPCSARPRLVVRRQLLDRVQIEPPRARQQLRAPQRRRFLGQRLAEPGADRRHEPHLRPVEHVLGQIGLQRLLHQPLALPRLDAERRRQRRHELDQPIVEQRLARLQAHRHARAIDLGQDVARQPVLDIGILRPVERVARRRPAHGIGIALLGGMPRQRLAHRIAE
jgi:hypothetical protein